MNGSRGHREGCQVRIQPVRWSGGLQTQECPYSLLSSGASVCLRVPAGLDDTSSQDHCFSSSDWVPRSKFGRAWGTATHLSVECGQSGPSEPARVFTDMFARSA